MVPKRGLPHPLGVTAVDGGVNVAIASEVADAVEVCLFDGDGNEERIELPERTAHVWHGFLPDIAVGQRYGLRVQGPWDPGDGLRCNPAKLLLDPHARAIDGEVRWDESVFGHRLDEPNVPNDGDSAAAMPRCVVTDRAFDWSQDCSPNTPLSETVIYETHVKGLTKRHPDVPDELRGTYAGLAHPAITGYLTDLGITAVELLPVHQFVQDSHLLDRNLRNYWGYNRIGYLAPHGDYGSSGTTGGQVDEFKAMVRALHTAGLEVILDVVYNHTAEGGPSGTESIATTSATSGDRGGGTIDITDRNAPSPDGSESLGELIAATTRDLSALMRTEVELAKTEIGEEVAQAGRAGAMIGAGALVGFPDDEQDTLEPPRTTEEIKDAPDGPASDKRTTRTSQAAENRELDPPIVITTPAPSVAECRRRR